MRAVLIHAADGPESVTVGERDVREPEAGEVLLRVQAAAVNPTDIGMWRSVGGGAVPVPFTAGMDAAGVVERVGAGVEHVSVGQRVMAVVIPRRPEGGAQAELVVLPAASVVGIPDEMDVVAASTLPMNGLTALEGLAVLDLPAGSTLAVTGGAGLLASYVIPLAKRAGLRVLADANPADAELVRGFGADVVLPRGDFAGAVLQEVPGGVDAVFDTAVLTTSALPAIRDGGAIAVVRGWSEPEPDRGVRVHRVSVANAVQNTEWLGVLVDEVVAGRILLRVADTYAAADARAAYERTEAGGIRGRAVLTF